MCSISTFRHGVALSVAPTHYIRSMDRKVDAKTLYAAVSRGSDVNVRTRDLRLESTGGVGWGAIWQNDVSIETM